MRLFYIYARTEAYYEDQESKVDLGTTYESSERQVAWVVSIEEAKVRKVGAIREGEVSGRYRVIYQGIQKGVCRFARG